MTVALLVLMTLVLVPFVLASARHLVVRFGRPRWVHRRLVARGPGTGFGAGAAVTEELHAFFNSNKRVEQEQRRVDLVLRDDEADGAPPRMGIDLDGGRATIRRTADRDARSDR